MTHVHREQVPPTVDALIFNELHDEWAQNRSADEPAPWEPASYLYSNKAFRRLGGCWWEARDGSKGANSYTLSFEATPSPELWSLLYGDQPAPLSVREREQRLMERDLR